MRSQALVPEGLVVFLECFYGLSGNAARTEDPLSKLAHAFGHRLSQMSKTCRRQSRESDRVRHIVMRADHMLNEVQAPR